MNIPFQAIDWSEIPKTEHRGERGTSWWQTLQFGGLRLRLVEYSTGYLADHWCRKGHIVHCLRGAFLSELESGETVALQAGESYIVTDEASSHRSSTDDGAQLLIIDGDFLAWQGAGLLPDAFETERLQLSIIRIPDAAFLRRLVNTPGWLRFIGDRAVHTDTDAVRYIQRMTSGPGSTVHVIRRKEDGTPIGITTLIQRPWLDRPDIGFALLPEYEGKGYAREASAALLEALRLQGKMADVFAITVPGNERSIGLLQRLGFTEIERRRQDGEEVVIFGIKLS